MTNSEIDTLLKKFQSGSITPQELSRLEEWYDGFDPIDLSRIPTDTAKLNQLLRHIDRKITGNHYPKMRKNRTIILTTLSAVVAASVIFGLFWMIPIRNNSIEHRLKNTSHEVVLTLNNGTVVPVESASNIIEQGLTVKAGKSAPLDYSKNKTNTPNTHNLFNKIVVPIGKDYTVILSDGSKVYLNSESSLSYPVNFSGDCRQVVMTGEAYFEVTKSATPFVVIAGEKRIEVHGTSFDVSAYDNEELSYVALAEGAVSVGNIKGESYGVLRPGDVISFNKTTGEIVTQKEDVGLLSSWITGVFRFKEMKLDDIMRKLNRWYGYDVQYLDPKTKELRFTGAAEKNKPVQFLLEMIEKTTNVNAEIEGNTIKISKK